MRLDFFVVFFYHVLDVGFLPLKQSIVPFAFAFPTAICARVLCNSFYFFRATIKVNTVSISITKMLIVRLCSADSITAGIACNCSAYGYVARCFILGIIRLKADR